MKQNITIKRMVETVELFRIYGMETVEHFKIYGMETVELFKKIICLLISKVKVNGKYTSKIYK